jgi:diguanylate cyclase (GGDEF)-like protein
LLRVVATGAGVAIAATVGLAMLDIHHVAATVGVLVAVFGFLFAVLHATLTRVEAAQRELETVAVTDAVTGLANRRYLMARAAEECARIPRQRGRDPMKAGVGFIMADIDGFKTVNDTYGHLAGDEVLRAVAERIRRVTRRYDIVGRYGGDEFLVVVPGTDFDETGSVAERLWQVVREEPFTAGAISVPVTVSVGFTCADGDDVNAALKRADEALYRAKHGGRDRVIAL